MQSGFHLPCPPPSRALRASGLGYVGVACWLNSVYWPRAGLGQTSSRSSKLSPGCRSSGACCTTGWAAQGRRRRWGWARRMPACWLTILGLLLKFISRALQYRLLIYLNNRQRIMQQGWQLLSASKTITIHGPESEAGAPLAEYNPHRGIVNCAVYNHTGKVIASCGQDGKIALHSSQRCTDKLLQLTYHSAQEDPSSINCCLFSPKSKFIAAGSVNSTVKVWDMKTSKEKQALHKLKGHAGGVTSIAWINGEQIIASSSTSGDILLHDVTTGAIRDSLTSRLQEGINNIKMSEGEGYRRLGACTNSGSLMVWDLNVSSKKPIYSYEDPKKASFTCLSISQFKPVLLVCSSIDSSFTFMDINERKVVKTICTEEPLTAIAFDSEGQMIATGGMSGGLTIYDLRKIQTPVLKLNGHDTPIKSVCFSEKEKDKEGEKDRGARKDRDYGTSSTYSRTSSNPSQTVGDKEKNKVLTPVISSNKLIPEEDKGNRVRNLVKKEQPVVKPAMEVLVPPQKIEVQPQPPRTVQTSTIAPVTSTVVANQSYVRPATTITYSNPQASQQGPQMKALEQKLMGEMKNMEMRLNEKFEMLHLEVIRQTQLSVEKMAASFEKKYAVQKDLENKIKQLQEENENLRKRTY